MLQIQTPLCWHSSLFCAFFCNTQHFWSRRSHAPSLHHCAHHCRNPRSALPPRSPENCSLLRRRVSAYLGSWERCVCRTLNQVVCQNPYSELALFLIHVCSLLFQVSSNRDSIRAQLNQLCQYKGVLTQMHFLTVSQVQATFHIALLAWSEGFLQKIFRMHISMLLSANLSLRLSLNIKPTLQYWPSKSRRSE